MSINDIIDEALMPKDKDQYKIIENLSMGLDVVNLDIEEVWVNGSLKHAEAYRNIDLKTVSYREIFYI